MKQICRNLLIVASLIGFLPGLTRATQNPTAFGTVVARRSPVGTGLDSLVYWSTALPFLDVFKTSSPWTSGTVDIWDDHRSLNLDEHGWVRSLLPGQRATTLMMWGAPMWVNGVYRAPLGRYTVQYDGDGTLEYSGATVVQRDPGRDVIDVEPQLNEGLGLTITSVNPNNYLRNIRVLMPDATPGETFNPRFLDSLHGYTTLRFLSWSTGPDPEDYAVTPHTWATRPARQDARWESRRGAPLEIMVELCNRLHVNAWFNIPHLADDDFVRNFAQTLHDSLDPGLKVYVEHSNEVWNGSYQAQYNYAGERGLALGLSTDPEQARHRYNAFRTRQIGAIFRQVLGRDRVVVVLSTFQAIAAISDDMLGWNGTAADVDALATAPYFGYELGLSENDARVAQMSLDDLFRDLQTNWIPIMNSDTEQQAAVARKYGVPLISYEGGQHLANLDGPSSAKVNVLFDAANRDPRMGQIYSKYLEDWNRISGGGLWMHLMNCGEAGSVGRWGAMEYVGQPRSQAPKYDAIQRWIEQSSVQTPSDDLQALSDEFNDNSTLQQWQRVYSTEMWGANQLQLLDINTTRPGKLVMMPYTSTWYQDYRGELTFKTVQGDFVVTADVVASQRNGTGAPRSTFSLGGIMVRTPRQVTPQTWTPGGENYIFLSLGSADQPGTFQYEVKTTTNSDSRLEISPGTNHAIIQVARIGSSFITLTQAAGGTWRVHRRFRRTDMPQTLQVGMTTYTDYPNASRLSPFDHNRTVIHDGNPDLVAEFDYMRFQRPLVPAALLGQDLTDPSIVSDDQLLAFLGANANFTQRTGNPFNFADRGGISVSTQGGNGSTTVGYGQIQTSTGSPSPAGLAIFGFRQNGILVTEAGVPASPLVQSGRIYTEAVGSVNTGIAIANPNNQPATISYYFTNEAGQNFGQGTTTVGANGQIAKFLNEAPFGLTSSTGGTFTFSSSSPISVIALRGFTNQRSEFLITTLPLVDISASPTAPIVFPHFADGGGWSTQVILINPTDGALNGTMQFLSQGTLTAPGFPINLNANGQSSSTFQYAIPPRSSYRLRTSGLGTNTLSGWVRVAPGAGSIAPSGLVVFSYTNPAGITISEAGVPPLSADTAFRMYAEMSGAKGQIGSIQTGIAIANPGSTPATVNLDLTTLSGAANGMTASLTVPASGQIANFLNEIFTGLGSFKGVLHISSTSSVAVTGLRARYNERSEFLMTTTPPVNEKAVAPGATLVFSHFADGGGFTTQFVIFSAVPGQSSSGLLQLASQSGTPLSLVLQ